MRLALRGQAASLLGRERARRGLAGALCEPYEVVIGQLSVKASRGSGQPGEF